MNAESKRVTKNTIFMYFRMLFLVIIQLYTVPLILEALGVEDYGIYQVVGGFVSMFVFIQASLTSGCQRFIAYAIGKNDKVKLKEVFNVTQTIFICLSFLSLIIIEIIGLWFLNNKMQIPDFRLSAANIVFHFSVIAFVFSLLLTPYNSLIVAHERMPFYAYISIFDALYKLFVVITLRFFLYDRLIIYSVLVFSASLFNLIFVLGYCYMKFIESRTFAFKWNKTLFTDIGSYAGWNVMGALSNILRSQGLNVVMNLFFGPILNAAHAIATNINNFFYQIASNIYLTTRPQMVKLFAQERYEDMWKLIFRSSKYSFYLLSLIAVPLLIEMDFILNIWLKNVPPLAGKIASFLLLSSLVEALCNQIIGAFQAANRIKYYQIYSSIVLFSVVPLSLFFLSLISNPLVPYFLSLAVSLIYTVIILISAKYYIGFDINKYINDVVIRSLIPFLLSLIIVYFLALCIEECFLRVLLMIICSTMIHFMLIWVFGLELDEKSYVIVKVKKYLGK